MNSTSARRSITNWRCGKIKLLLRFGVPTPLHRPAETDCVKEAASRSCRTGFMTGVTLGIQGGTEVKQKLDTAQRRRKSERYLAGLVRYPHDLWQARDVELKWNMTTIHS